MDFGQIGEAIKLSAAYQTAILADGATDEAVRTSDAFKDVGEEVYAAARSMALEPLYAQAIKAGATAQQVEDFCYGKGIAKSVIDAVAANMAVSGQLTGQ